MRAAWLRRIFRWKVLRVPLGVLMVLLVALLYSTDWLAQLGGRLTGDRRARAERSGHFRDGAFFNRTPTRMMTPGSTGTMIRRQLFGDEKRAPSKAIPLAQRVAGLYRQAPPSGLRVTWLGHATALVELGARKVLTDPIFSERCSPSRWVGPKRFFPAALELDDIGPVDAVVISHDHYDHLDKASIVAIARTSPSVKFFVPLGIGAHLERWGVDPSRIVDLDWNESASLTTEGTPLAITALPARHYSGRSLWTDEMLWASWMFVTPEKKVFFSGDTGYHDGFREVGDRHGPFDLALLKIGAYDATWPDIHMSPEEAVTACGDLRATAMLPVHWGTFNLAFHAWDEPAERLLVAAASKGARVLTPIPGQAVEPATVGERESAPWWRGL